MEKTLQVSIIMPVRKIERWTTRILKNLEMCETTKIDVEFVFIYNSNAVDKSVESLKGTIRKNEYRYIRTKFSQCTKPGIYSAMNKGIEMVEGKMILFMGADDIITKGFREALKYIHKSKSKCIFAHVLKSNDQNEANNYKRAGGIAGQIHWILGMPRIHQAIFYNTEFIRSKKIQFRTDLKVTSDYIFTCEIMETMQERPEKIDIIVAIYNTTGFSSQFKAGQLYLEHIKGYKTSTILKKYFPIVLITRLGLIILKRLKFHLMRKP